MTEKIRFYEIDGLRFIAAAMVVFYHFTFRGFAADDLNVLSFPVIGEIARYGYLGVDLFFIISGFVILMTARQGDPIRFVISRMVRIYPAFWVCLTITAATMAVYNTYPFDISFSQWLINLPLIGSFIGVPYVDSVYWSLLVELKFYFLMYLILVCRGIAKIDWFLGVWLLISLVATFSEVWGAIHFFFFPEWSHYFIAGAMFYLIRVEGLNSFRSGVILCCFGLSVFQTTSTIAIAEAHYHTEFSQSFIISCILLFYLIFLAIALGKTVWIQSPHLTLVGALTYPLYLVHQNVGFIFFNVLAGELNKYLLLACGLILVVFLSYLVNRFVEQRFSKVFKGWLEMLAAAIMKALVSIRSRG